MHVREPYKEEGGVTVGEVGRRDLGDVCSLDYERQPYTLIGYSFVHYSKLRQSLYHYFIIYY